MTGFGSSASLSIGMVQTTFQYLPGLSEDLSVLARAVAEHPDSLSFEAILVLLRTTGWDTDYLLRCATRLVEPLPAADVRLRHEVVHGVWAYWLDRRLELEPEHELASMMRPDVATELEEQA